MQVNRKSYKRSGTFSTRAAATEWATRIEAEIDRAVANAVEPSWVAPEAPAQPPTMAEALTRYLEQVVPYKWEGRSEQNRVKALRRREIAGYRLDEIRPWMLAEFRDWRMETVKANTARLDLATISHLYSTAIKEWGWEQLENPVEKVANPKAPGPTERRLSDAEEKALVKACSESGNRYLLPAMLLSLETAVRRAELCRMRWSQTDLENRVSWLRVMQSKNKDYRALPLTAPAVRVIETLPREPGDDRLLQTTYRALLEAWKRARDRSGVEGFRWHDLRHEATSRLFEAGLGMIEAASVTGHRDPRMLRHYTHLQPSNIASKLDKARGNKGEG